MNKNVFLAFGVPIDAMEDFSLTFPSYCDLLCIGVRTHRHKLRLGQRAPSREEKSKISRGAQNCETSWRPLTEFWWCIFFS